MEDLSDEALMPRYREGNSKAFETLYRRHKDPFYRYVRRNVFREDLLPRLALEVPAGMANPRVRGLRHSFAGRTLLRWYREDLDPAARLHHLSTFLGHANPQRTAVYLTITSELLAEANRRFEALAPTLPEVTS